MIDTTIPGRPLATGSTSAAGRLQRAVDRLSTLLATYSVPVLRISLGVVFLAFGVLKFFPGVSPAEDLSVATIDKLTLGIISGSGALLLTAIMETFIGITLITGKLVRVGLVTLGIALVGIMSPLVLFFGDMITSTGPTLVAQYVFKDIVLAAAGLVIGARALATSRA